MAVTFTNKAAGEMRERVGCDAERRTKRHLDGHLSCPRRTPPETAGPELGWTRAFTIRDAEQSLREVKKAQKSVDVNPVQWSPRAMRDRISEAKNHLIGVEAFAKAHGDGADMFLARAARVYPAYQQALRRQDAMDFDDLLMQPVRLFEGNADLLRRYQSRFGLHSGG